MFKEKRPMVLVTFMLASIASLIGTAATATHPGTGSMEEIVVYGVNSSMRAANEAAYKARMRAQVEALNMERRRALDAKFARPASPKLRFAVAARSARG